MHQLLDYLGEEPPTLHIEMLLQVMENQRTGLVVIMAGYADRMDRFFNDVPDLSSRIGHHIDFLGYSSEELLDISRLMSREQQYVFSPEAERAIPGALHQRPRLTNPSPGGT